MFRTSLSLGVAVLFAILMAGWSGAEGRAFFGSLFQDAALSNSTSSSGPLAQLLEALAAAQESHSFGAFSDLFFGKR